MTSETERHRRSGLKAILRDIQNPLPEEDSLLHPVPPEAQEKLWTYALGLLEPDEERQVFRLLASSPRAEDSLSQIRQAMGETGVPNPIEPMAEDEPPESEAAVILRRAAERFRSLLGRLSDELAAAAAIVVNLGDRLVGAVGTAEPRLLETPAAVTLDGIILGADAPTPEPKGRRIDIPPLEGLGATAIFMASDRVDLLVTVSDPPVKGRVRLVRLVESATKLVEEDTGIDGYLRGNEPARLEECPSGMFKIIAPDGRQLVVCLGEPA